MNATLRTSLFALFAAAVLAGAAGASSNGPELSLAAASVDSNGFITYSNLANNVEVGTSNSFVVSVTNNTNQALNFIPAASVTFGGSPVGAPAARFSCSPCVLPALGIYPLFVTIDGTGATPGTYQVSVTASDAAFPTLGGSSPTYSTVISSSAGTLAKNSLSASTLMTINLVGTKVIFSAPPIQATDSTAGAPTLGSPIVLILNNVGTSSISVTDGNNTITLGAGDVIAAAFWSSVRASVIDGTSGSLRVGM
jgi:hypothetical protein